MAEGAPALIESTTVTPPAEVLGDVVYEVWRAGALLCSYGRTEHGTYTPITDRLHANHPQWSALLGWAWAQDAEVRIVPRSDPRTDPPYTARIRDAESTNYLIVIARTTGPDDGQGGVMRWLAITPGEGPMLYGDHQVSDADGFRVLPLAELAQNFGHPA